MSGAGARYLRFAAQATAVGAVLAVAAVALTRELGGPGARPAALAGLAVCWIGSLVGGVPLLRAGRGGGAAAPGAMVTGALAAMGLRLLVVAAGAAVLALSGAVPRAPLLLWTGVGYLALLAVDTRYAVGETRAHQAAAEAGEGSTAEGSTAEGSTRGRDAAPGRPRTTTETR